MLGCSQKLNFASSVRTILELTWNFLKLSFASSVRTSVSGTDVEVLESWKSNGVKNNGTANFSFSACYAL